jgi:NTE family protein
MNGRGKALVLGGGGVTGVAWEIGMLAGLAELGVDFSGADLVVGTSAGSVVGAQLLSGVPLEDLYEAQLGGTTQEIPAKIGAGFLLTFVASAILPNGRAWLGHRALKARTVPAEERRRVIEQRIARNVWPETPLVITAVEAKSGKFVQFTKESGVELVDAVAASCAVPLVWPPHPINGVKYIDGGARTSANVDVAKGCERLVVFAPVTGLSGRPAKQAQNLRVPYAVVVPNDLALSKMGRNPLDPAFRASAAEAGRQQAKRDVEKIREVWLSN